MSQDKQTINVLILELATMVVAIALAFTSSFVTTLNFNQIISFIFTNTVVIWFWWGYVMDRLQFPPKTARFPLLDILVLILISLIPFALRQGHVAYLSGVVGALILIWALMIRVIIRENSESINQSVRSELKAEVRQRLIVGLLFVLASALSLISSFVGIEVFVALVVLIIGWNVYTRRRRNTMVVASPTRQ